MAVIEEEQIHENEANINKLCDDMVEQLLLSLPIKSLLRFKAVCKSWYNLISDPRFVNLNVCRQHNVGRIHLSSYNCFYRVELENDELHKEVRRGKKGLRWCIQVVEICNPFDVPLYWFHVAGSCNGVLFVTTIHGDDPFLWNPSTREHVQLPPTNAMHKLFCRYCEACGDSVAFRTFAGLGYNSMFDEYKAILFLVGYKRDSGHSPNVGSQLLIYSSKVGYWKEVDQDVPYCFCQRLGLGVTVNGCPHWIVNDCKDYKYSKQITIMFFDTMDDKFKRLPAPIRWCDYYYEEHEIGPSPSLSVLGDCLCATTTNRIDNTTDVWVLNEYGVGDSWNKFFVIPDSNIRRFQIVPLGFMNHGDELVLEVNRQMVMAYNLKTKAQKFVTGRTTDRLTFFPLRGNFNAVDYVPSLVSPCRFLRDENKKQEEEEK